MQPPSTDQLRALEEELRALKARFGKGLKIKRANAAGTGGATPPTTPRADATATSSSPFPLTLTVAVPAPPSAQLYDVDGLELELKVHATAALRPPPLDAVEIALGPGPGPAPLPGVTRAAGAALLARRWRDDVVPASSSSAASSGGPLGALILMARSAFSDVVTSAPQALEPYEAVDDRGLTVRRVALVEPAVPEEPVEEEEEKKQEEKEAEDEEETKAAEPPPAPPPKASAEAAEAAVAAAAASSAAAVRRALLSREVEALRKRFGAAMELSEGDSNAKPSPQQQQQQQQQRHFHLSLAPTDPEWGDRGPLRLALAVTADQYPAQGSVRVSALAAPPRLPASQAGVLSRLAAEEAAAAAGQAGLLRGVLRRLENYAGAALREAEEQQHLSDDGYGSGFGGSSDEDEDEEESEDEEDDGNHDEVALPGAAGAEPQSSSSSSSGTFSVLVPALELDNVGVAELLNPSVEVSCARCDRPAALALEQQSGPQQHHHGDHGAVVFRPPKPVPCAGCHQPLWCELRPRALHAANNALGALDCRSGGGGGAAGSSSSSSCRPRDLLPSTFAAQCGACGAVLALRGVQVGKRAERACSSCHRPVALLLPAVAFVPRASAAAGGGGGRNGGGAKHAGPSSSSSSYKPVPYVHLFAAAAALPTGVPLPEMGACRHYRHSYRWLRFPCCGRRFPCDLCHEEGIEDGHEMRWATRMTCGYCSSEQSVARRCAKCGKALAATGARPTGDTTTRHWEGGKGCRDKRLLDRRDAAKYRGSKFKTKSKKGERVGQKGSGAGGGGGGGGG